jgi:integrase/recombinase XerD
MNVKLDFLKKFTDTMEIKKYSPRTIDSYCWHLDKFLLFKKDHHCSILSSQDINDYLVLMAEQDRSDSYINQAVNAIKFFFTYALNRAIKDRLVIRPKRAKTSPILLSDEELRALFAVCQNKKHKAIIMLLYGAGLRRSEVVNLKIADIDSKNMNIHVVHGKGRKSRPVMLDQNVLDALRDYFREFNPKGEYLFNGQNNASQYSASSIEKLVKDYGNKAGIKKKVYPHLLRHVFCTGVLENGGTIYDAQILLGHERTETTNGYAHLSPKYIASIKSPIGNLIRSVPVSTPQ